MPGTEPAAKLSTKSGNHSSGLRVNAQAPHLYPCSLLDSEDWIPLWIEEAGSH